MPLDLSGLERIRSGLAQAIDAGVQESAEQIRDLASQLAPKDTGALSESGQIDGADGVRRISFGNGLPDIRAVVQEYGSVNQAAQPYLTPAAEAIDVTQNVTTHIKDLL